MLSPQEALMMQAAYDEQDRLQAQNTAGLLGAAGGGLMGAAAGSIPHKIGSAVNALKGTPATGMRAMKPGFRAAGGLNRSNPWWCIRCWHGFNHEIRKPCCSPYG
jgi:hypothetical protein